MPDPNRCPNRACVLPKDHNDRHANRDGTTWPRQDPALTLPGLADYARAMAQTAPDADQPCWLLIAEDIEAYLGTTQEETLL